MNTPHAPDRLGRAKKIAQNIVSEFSEDGLGVKLNSLHDIIPVPHAHYYAFRRFSTGFETGWKAVTFDDQGMIARCRKGIGQIPVDSLAIMVDEGGLGVDWPASADLAPVGVANALMPQAYAQNGDLPANLSHYVITNACLQRSARPRGDHNVAGGHCLYLS